MPNTVGYQLVHSQEDGISCVFSRKLFMILLFVVVLEVVESNADDNDVEAQEAAVDFHTL